MARKSHVYSVRLHPHDQMEREAITTIEEMKRNGFNFRQVITDWANRYAGNTPEMFKRDDATPSGISLDDVQRLLEAQTQLLLRALSRGDIVVNAGDYDDAPDDDSDILDAMTPQERTLREKLLMRMERHK